MHENEASPASSLCRYNLILDDSLKRREPQLLRCSSTIYSSLKTRHPLLHRYVCVFLSPPLRFVKRAQFFRIFLAPFPLGVKDNFVVGHIIYFSQYTKVRLGYVSLRVADYPAMSFIFVCWHTNKDPNANKLSWVIN